MQNNCDVLDVLPYIDPECPASERSEIARLIDEQLKFQIKAQKPDNDKNEAQYVPINAIDFTRYTQLDADTVEETQKRYKLALQYTIARRDNIELAMRDADNIKHRLDSTIDHLKHECEYYKDQIELKHAQIQYINHKRQQIQINAYNTKLKPMQDELEKSLESAIMSNLH